MEDRPAPSPAKLLTQFNDWIDETEMPGRTMAYLKTGYLPEVLEAQESDSVSKMVESWNGWEAGKTRPELVLEVLREQGLSKLLEELSK